jgi:hypothetical protein
VSGPWSSIGDAVTCANSLMGSCGWFVPSVSQLQNPGHACKTYWDSYTSAHYWSSTELTPGHAYFVNFGENGFTNYTLKWNPYSVRAFRCTPT